MKNYYIWGIEWRGNVVIRSEKIANNLTYQEMVILCDKMDTFKETIINDEEFYRNGFQVLGFRIGLTDLETKIVYEPQKKIDNQESK